MLAVLQPECIQHGPRVKQRGLDFQVAPFSLGQVPMSLDRLNELSRQDIQPLTRLAVLRILGKEVLSVPLDATGRIEHVVKEGALKQRQSLGVADVLGGKDNETIPSDKERGGGNPQV